MKLKNFAYKCLNMEIVKKYTKLMLNRRGYKVPDETTRAVMKPISPEFYIAKSTPCFEKNKNREDEIIVFFITKENVNSDKITINIFKLLLIIAEHNYHIIIVHDSEMSLTSDVKINIGNFTNDVTKKYIIEIFESDKLSVDLYEILFIDKDDDLNIKFCQNINDKLPLLCLVDPLVRYIGASPGDILQGRFRGDDTISERRVLNSIDQLFKI